MRALRLLFAVVVGCITVVHSQHLVSCTDNVACSDGFYCESTTHTCRECIRCENLNREPPGLHIPNICIKSFTNCGSCLKGYIIDPRDDLKAQCVPSDTPNQPPYVWVIIGLFSFLLVVIFCCIFVVIFCLPRKGDTSKILASIRASLRSPCMTSEHASASAPDLPPPYNPYTPVRTDSPFGLPDSSYTEYHNEESSRQFVKRAPSSSLPQVPRESADNQNARVFRNPAYLRNEQPPPSPNSPTSETNTEINDNHFLSLHDEDTTESTWTPNGDANSNSSSNEAAGGSAAGAGAGAGAAALPALLAAARDSSLLGPPAKKLRQDTSSNGEREPGAGGDGGDSAFGSSSRAQNAPSFYVNVQINNTKF